MSPERRTFDIAPAAILKVFLFVIGAALLWYLRDLIIVVLTAVVIASAIEPGVAFFVRHGLRRVFATILMYLIIGGVFFGVIFFFIPPILSDAAGFLTKLPETLTNLNISDVTHGLLPWGPVSNTLSSADLLRSISTTINDTTGGVFTTLSAFFGGLTSFILIVVFSFYFSVLDTGVDDFLRVVTPAAQQPYVLSVWKRSQRKIGLWMQGQLVLALIVGVLLFLGLTILGIPYALLLAVIAAVFELIPVFGQVLAAIPAVAIAYLNVGPTAAALVIGLYVVVQQFEAHLIYPVVVKKVVGIPPLLVILSLLVGFKLVGFLGVLLSVPVAGAIQELVVDLEKSRARALARMGQEG